MEEQFPSKEKVGGSNPPRGKWAGSSVVERRPDKTEVVGSIPTLPNFNFCRGSSVVERQPEELRVGGSIPSHGINEKRKN